MSRRYQTILIAVVSWTEALGFDFPTAAEQARMEFFLRGLQIYPFTMAEARYAIQYRKVRRIQVPDAVTLLATARAAGADLLTQNTKGFVGIDWAVRVLTVQEL